MFQLVIFKIAGSEQAFTKDLFLEECEFVCAIIQDDYGPLPLVRTIITQRNMYNHRNKPPETLIVG